MENTYMAYEWFKELILNEIENEIATIGNERMWSNGSPDEETSAIHNDNIETHELYIRILKEAYRNATCQKYP